MKPLLTLAAFALAFAPVAGADAKLSSAEKKMVTTPSRFFGDGNTVVVLTDLEISGARTNTVDVLESTRPAS